MVALALIRMAFNAQPLRVSQKVIGVAAVYEVAGKAAVAAGHQIDVVVICERPFLVAVAIEAEPVTVLLELVIVPARMRVVAGEAVELPFRERMMRTHVELRAHILVAAET
jgi:hypothetical protein